MAQAPQELAARILKLDEASKLALAENLMHSLLSQQGSEKGDAFAKAAEQKLEELEGNEINLDERGIRRRLLEMTREFVERSEDEFCRTPEDEELIGRISEELKKCDSE